MIDVEVALGELLARGEARLPHRPVTADAFAERIRGTPRRAIDAAALQALHGADLYLACALSAGDPRALAIAEAELIPVARDAIRRIDGDPAFLDELAQRLRARLFVGPTPAIDQYRGRGSLAGWVKVVARRLAIDAKRAEPDAQPDDPIANLPAPDDPELAVIWQRCAAEYQAALAAGFASLSKRDRNLMRQRYLDELNIDALGRLYGVHPATAFRWLKDVEQRLATATRAAVMTKLSLSDSQARSIERLIASQLQLSLTRLLRVKRA